MEDNEFNTTGAESLASNPPYENPNKSKDRIHRFAGDNESIAGTLKNNILAVAKSKQKLDGGLLVLIVVYLAIGVGSRFIIRSYEPGTSPTAYYISLITSVILLVIHILTKKLLYGKLRDMITSWYVFAQVGLIMTATYIQASYFAFDSTSDLSSFLMAFLTWVVSVVCIIFVYRSTVMENLEINPFLGFSIKKTYEWQRIRKERDKKYGLLRDLFAIPVIYGVAKFFCCLITNVLAMLAGANTGMSESVNKFLEIIAYIDWGVVGFFLIMAIVYTILYTSDKEPEKETTEYIDMNDPIFDEEE